MSVVDSLQRLQRRSQRTVDYLSTSRRVIVLTAVVFLLAPVALNLLSIDISLMIELIIWGLGAYGVLLVFGYTGLLSFGHAVFFGVGSFTVTLMVNETGLPLLVILVAAILVSLVFAAFIGYFSIRQYGIYFAIITLGFAELFRLITLYPLQSITGGQNGVAGAVVKPPVDLGIVSFDINDSLVMYGFLAVLALLWLITFRQLLYSQLGRALVAVRENESRAKSIGYNVQWVKLKAFIISGGITGLAGGLYALYLGYSNASHMHWSNSGDFLFIVLIGGTFNFMGAFIGSLVFRGLNFFLSHIEWWPLIVGAILILTVHYAPAGILGLIESEED